MKDFYSLYPKNIRDIKPALVMKKILDYQLEDMPDKYLHDLVKEMVLTGNSVMKVAWDNKLVFIK